MTSEALLIDRRNEVRWYPMRVTSAPDDSVSVMAWNDDFFGKPGTKVRITDGDFKGVEGVIRRIKQNKRMIKLSGAKTSVFSTRTSEPERDYRGDAQ